MYKLDLASDNTLWLICHETKLKINVNDYKISIDK